jgi:hypothetical protein
MFDVETLNKFYDYISAVDGVGITDFQNRLKTLFAMDRSDGDLNDYRLGKNQWKKLRDEITPVSHFLQFKKIEAGKIRFPLDNNTPDCWLSNDNGDDLGIEVTIERGREKYHLVKEMNEAGIGRGFIGIQDDAPQADFDKRMSNPRTMYVSEQALEATKNGILLCLSKKNDPRYEGVFYLLIQAHLSTLPKERWGSLIEELSQNATDLPFQEVYIIGKADAKPWGFQVK